MLELANQQGAGSFVLVQIAKRAPVTGSNPDNNRGGDDICRCPRKFGARGRMSSRVLNSKVAQPANSPSKRVVNPDLVPAINVAVRMAG